MSRPPLKKENVSVKKKNKMNNYILDESTQRLLDLTSKSERLEDDVDEIIFLIQQKVSGSPEF